MLVAHLSDPHIRTGPLAGEPAANLQHALGCVLALRPRPDCVVITGDLCQFGDSGSYSDLRILLEDFPLPLHLTTGNHDDPDALVAAFAGTAFLGGAAPGGAAPGGAAPGGGAKVRYRVDHPGLTIVALDSRRPDSPAGLLGDDQLAWLDGVLAERPEVPAFVCLHHPPVPVGIPFLDGMRLDDGPALAEVISRHRNVARVLAGHVHRVVMVPFAGTMVVTAPSTYRQSGLRMHDDQPPGYLAEPTGFLLHQLTGAEWVTHVMPASHAAGLLGVSSPAA